MNFDVWEANALEDPLITFWLSQFLFFLDALDWPVALKDRNASAGRE